MRVGAYKAPAQIHRVVLQVYHVHFSAVVLLANDHGGTQMYLQGGE